MCVHNMGVRGSYMLGIFVLLEVLAGITQFCVMIGSDIYCQICTVSLHPLVRFLISFFPLSCYVHKKRLCLFSVSLFLKKEIWLRFVGPLFWSKSHNLSFDEQRENDSLLLRISL